MAPLGSLVGLGLTGVIAAGVDVDDPVDCMQRLEEMIWIQNIVITITCVLLFIFHREKPVSPPSKLSLTYSNVSQNGIC